MIKQEKFEMSEIESIMRRSPVIPVIVINDPEDAVPLAKALVAGGLSVLEVTLRTEHALQAIADIKREVAGAIVGAGTVISADDVARSISAGAKFLVSPGSAPKMLDAALQCSVPLLPGVSSPSEVMALMERGLRYMKFFPAEQSGGAKYLAALHGPLADVQFCPTGGVNPANASDYLSLPNVLCVGGSWMMDKAAIANKDWQTIERLARDAASLSV